MEWEKGEMYDGSDSIAKQVITLLSKYSCVAPAHS